MVSWASGFDALGKVKMICATNRPDVLDPGEQLTAFRGIEWLWLMLSSSRCAALMRPGRLDRKVEIPLPNEVCPPLILIQPFR